MVKGECHREKESRKRKYGVLGPKRGAVLHRKVREDLTKSDV